MPLITIIHLFVKKKKTYNIKPNKKQINKKTTYLLNKLIYEIKK